MLLLEALMPCRHKRHAQRYGAAYKISWRYAMADAAERIVAADERRKDAAAIALFSVITRWVTSTYCRHASFTITGLRHATPPSLSRHV